MLEGVVVTRCANGPLPSMLQRETGRSVQCPSCSVHVFAASMGSLACKLPGSTNKELQHSPFRYHVGLLRGSPFRRGCRRFSTTCGRRCGGAAAARRRTAAESSREPICHAPPLPRKAGLAPTFLARNAQVGLPESNRSLLSSGCRHDLYFKNAVPFKAGWPLQHQRGIVSLDTLDNIARLKC